MVRSKTIDIGGDRIRKSYTSSSSTTETTNEEKIGKGCGG
jgi:hypothetical protein